MVAFAGTVNRGVATRSTFAPPVHDNSEKPEFVMQAGEGEVEEVGGVPPELVAGEVVVEVRDVPAGLAASEVVVDEEDELPADPIDDPPIVSASTTATTTTTLGTA